MHGQVWEWCADSWHDDYRNAPQDSRVWDEKYKNDNYYQNIAENLTDLPNDDRLRVRRGGSWLNQANGCRSAFRIWINPVGSSVNDGFRVACGGA